MLLEFTLENLGTRKWNLTADNRGVRVLKLCAPLGKTLVVVVLSPFPVTPGRAQLFKLCEQVPRGRSRWCAGPGTQIQGRDREHTGLSQMFSNGELRKSW